MPQSAQVDHRVKVILKLRIKPQNGPFGKKVHKLYQLQQIKVYVADPLAEYQLAMRFDSDLVCQTCSFLAQLVRNLASVAAVNQIAAQLLQKPLDFL